MAVPVRHGDILRNYVTTTANPAWARDLVCLAVNTNGNLSDDDRMLIWQEYDSGSTTTSQVLPPGLGAPYPKVELMKLSHHHGVNALAGNQDIVFCNEGITLLFGQNRSGKSGYFRVLNQLASGKIPFKIHKHLYSAAPDPISVSVEYHKDGINQPVFTWDGESPCPQELRHIRCFDSHYAAHFLEPRDGNTYLFDSYSLKVFRSINETLHYLKEDLGLAIDATTESALNSLCTSAYRDSLKQALLGAFRNELANLGMQNLNANLVVDDLLADGSKIAIQIVNNLNVESVLSEAELKCAAIALFLAECELMAVKQPIIFDDPVNSLDNIIIQAFAERLSRMDCEVVVFTHNILLMEALTDKRKFKVYYDPSANRSAATTAKKHVLMYDIVANDNNTGFVMGASAKKTKFFLDRANSALATAGPLSNVNHIISDLRMAVEWAIDEVVFRGLVPHRFKGNQQIDWQGLRDMASAGDQNINDLKTNYDKLSTMGMHLGIASYAVTPTPAGLQAIHDDILRIIDSSNIRQD